MSTDTSQSTDLNLLVVDWDFFFTNPMLSAEYSPDMLMYDWSHSEGKPDDFQDMVWTSRAGDFFRRGMEPPKVQGWEKFWDRFTFRHNDVPLLYADSNMHAGIVTPLGMELTEDETVAWNTVWLWDAHHDCGYKGSYEDWEPTGTVSCENWMLAHHQRGTALNVTYPTWRVRVSDVEPEPLVPVTRVVDDGTNPDMVFDGIFVCRSGAWVPPWCDNEFDEFLKLAPTSRQDGVLGYEFVNPRRDVLDDARKLAEAILYMSIRMAEQSSTHE